jgi:hypothetical protein
MNHHPTREGDSAPHHHSTISEAGACSECRASNISVVKDAPHAFLLTFPPDDGAPRALSLIRSWSPDASLAADTAWATGCNLDRGVLIVELPVAMAVESGIEMFRLHEGIEADGAFRVIRDLWPVESPTFWR